MDYQDIRTLQLLEEIEQNHAPSQRYLAKQLNVSLGMVNSFIKRLAKKGYFKITTIPKNRVKYILTPKGMAEKTQLTYQYIQYSYQFYKEARTKLAAILKDLEAQGVRQVVFFGVSLFTEIAYISLQETSLEMTGIVSQSNAERKFMNYDVHPVAEIHKLPFDRILITSEKRVSTAKNLIIEHGIEDYKIVIL